MTDYQGCKCPICQELLTADDDIVVCPDCGTPYHRACWEKTGACVFVDRHGPGFEYHRPEEGPRPLEGPSEPSAAAEKPCPACGAQNPAANLFCENCGAPMRGTAGGAPGSTAYDYSRPQEQQGAPDPLAMAGVSPNQEFEGVSAKDWSTYLGRSSPYYLLLFRRMDETKRKIFPSLSAFIFGPLFLLYRKVWNWGILASVVYFLGTLPNLLYLILNAADPSAQPAALLTTLVQVSSFLLPAIKLAISLFAFSLVRREGAKKIHRLKERAATPEAYQVALAAHASPSVAGVIVYFVVAAAAMAALIVAFGVDPLSLFMF